MAITGHVNYSNKALQAYKLGSMLAGRLSQEYKFGEYKSVVISTITTTPYGDYTRSGVARYGTPTEVEDTTQELICTQDKAFAKTIDKGNIKDQNHLKKAGQVVALQIKEQGIPMTDTYAFTKIVAGAGTTTAPVALTKTTVMEHIYDGTATLDENEIPQDGRILFVNPAVYKLIKMSPEFVNNNDLGKKAVRAGSVGEIDGMEVVKVPVSRLGADVNFILMHKSAAILPIKIEETKIHQDPPGINGDLIEGRQYYDCFVFDQRKKGIYVDKAVGK